MRIRKRRNGSLAKAKPLDKNKRKATGTVYVMKCWIDTLDGKKTVYKIGYTARSGSGLEMRMSEIAVSCYKVYGYMPEIEPIRLLKTRWYTEVEKYLHTQFSKDRVLMDDQISGFSEFFSLDEARLVQMYDKVMKAPMQYVTPSESTKAKKVTIPVVTGGVNDVKPVVIP